MPARLEFKVPAPGPLSREVAVALLAGVPIVWVLWLRRTGGMVAFARPWAQFFSDALILGVPLVWAGLFLTTRVKYKPTSEEVLGRTYSLRVLAGGWWMFALLWPSVFLPLLFVARRAAAPPSFDADDILLLWAVTLVVALFWGTTLFAGKEIRISDEGIRTGPLNFTEWERLDHVGVRGERIDLHHHANPALPLTCVRLEDAAARARLMDAVRAHQVPVDSTTAPALHATRALVGLATVAIVVIGAFADARGVWPYWILLLACAVGVAGTLLLERFRGMGKVTRIKPMLEAPVPRTPLEMSTYLAGKYPTLENRADVRSDFARAQRIYLVSSTPVTQMFDDVGVPVEALKDVLAADSTHGASLLVFTSVAEAGRCCPDGHPVPVKTGTVRDVVRKKGLAGIVIDSAGPGVYLSTEEIGE